MVLRKNERLKVGIVGCGNIANLQLRYIRKYIAPENLAICDQNQLRMSWLAEEYEIANTFRDFDEMLEGFRPNVVHVLTPPKTHRNIVLQCIKNGSHVFLEKPMCLSAEEAEAIVEAANKLKRLVCIDHLRLFDPQVLKVKSIIESGEVGDILSVSTTQVGNYLDRKRQGLTSQWMHKLPGEFFFDILPHHISLLNEFMPQLRYKTAVCQNDEHGTPRLLHCLLFSTQGTAAIRLSATGYPENIMVFKCTRGIITLDFNNRTTVIRKSGGLPGAIDRIWGEIRAAKQMVGGTIGFLAKRPDNLAGMDNTIERFYTAIANEDKSPIPAENGLTVMRLMEDIFRETSHEKAKQNVNNVPGRIEFKSNSRQEKCDILVTGGSGFIGRNLVRRLLSSGNTVRIFTHRGLKDERGWSDLPGSLEIFKGNISNPMDVENACKGVRAVYHLAAATKGPWLYHLDTTVGGTQNVIDACCKYGVESLVYVSTIGVFNTANCAQADFIDEDFPYEENPKRRGNYRNSKLMAEKIVMQFMEDPDTKAKVNIIRPGIVYGPGKDPLLGIIKQISKRVSISLELKKRILPLVYMENLVDALVLACNASESGVYNIVDKECITVKEFVKAYKKASGGKFVVVYLPPKFLGATFWFIDKMAIMLLGKPSFLLYNMKAKGHRHMYSTEKIEHFLGWESKTGFDVGISVTLREEL